MKILNTVNVNAICQLEVDKLVDWLNKNNWEMSIDPSLSEADDKLFSILGVIVGMVKEQKMDMYEVCVIVQRDDKIYLGHIKKTNDKTYIGKLEEANGEDYLLTKLSFNQVVGWDVTESNMRCFIEQIMYWGEMTRRSGGECIRFDMHISPIITRYGKINIYYTV